MWRMASVIVLAGGVSDERKVSLRSGEAVSDALKEADHVVSILDPAEGLDEQLTSLQLADVIFPALHGKGGEDGTVQRFLEDHSLRYVGSDAEASEKCYFKDRYPELLASQGVQIPDAQLVNYDEFKESPLAQAPYVLKPNDGGSSIDTFVVRDPAVANAPLIEQAFSRHDKLLLQKLISGQEITVSILLDEVLPVIEIVPPNGQEFNYENKYNGATRELCPPVSVPADVQKAAQKLALSVHRAMGCRDLSRSDFMIGVDGTLFLIDINTIPGLTPQSLLPKAAAVAGYDMPKVCDCLVNTAQQR